jgi:Na+/H+ antiporter NhaC
MKYAPKKEARASALLPFIIFIVIYLGAGIYFQVKGVDMAFYQFPSVTAMFIAVLSAFCLGPEPIMYKFSIFSKGAANNDVMAMLMIYILAGAFSAVAAAMGGKDATVSLGLSLIPAEYMTVGVFIISAFMGTATGTSVGTVASLVPIAAGIGLKAGIPTPLIVAACVSGAMFGDNLSMISDTTIAATRTQGCELKDKFKINFFIALPAAIITAFLFLVLGKPTMPASLGDTSFSLVKVLPYLVVLGLSLLGTNVFLVLVIGIFLAGGIGLFQGDLTIISFAQNIWNGFTSMNEAFFLALFCGGISEVITHYGGITWLIEHFRRMIHGFRSAQLCISALVSLVDCATANNTVAIIVSGTVAREISHEFKVDPRRTASLLDIFSCVFQGILPYGAQLLTASALVTQAGYNVSSLEIVPHMWYCWALAIFGLLSIIIPFADATIRKHPWDWEQGRAK